MTFSHQLKFVPILFLTLSCIKKQNKVNNNSQALATGSDSKTLKIFTDTVPIEFELKAPYATIEADRRKKQPATQDQAEFKGHPSSLVLTTASGKLEVPVLVRARGKTSRGECALPKLTIHIPKDSRNLLVGTDFEKAKNLKVGTHCSVPFGMPADLFIPFVTFGRLKDDRAPWREELLYRIYALLSEDHVKTRAVKIKYTNTDTQTASNEAVELADRIASFDIETPKRAFLFETAGTLIDRLGGEDVWQEIELESPVPPNLTYDETTAETMAAFQVLFGNGDWGFEHGNIPLATGSPSLWNILSFFNKTATASPTAKFMPIDFDIATFVKAKDTENLEASDRLSESFLGDIPAGPRLIAYDYYDSANETVFTDPSKRSQVYKTVAAKAESLIALVKDSSVDELTKKRLTNRIQFLAEAVNLNLLDFAVTKRDTVLKNKSGACDLSRSSTFTVISETPTELNVALPSWFLQGECNPNFSRFNFKEVIGNIPKSQVIGSNFMKLVPSEKRRPENKTIVSPPLQVVFFGFNASSKPTPVKSVDGKASCNLAPGDAIAIKIDEQSLDNRDGSNAELVELIEGCKTLTLGTKISVDLKKAIEPAGG